MKLGFWTGNRRNDSIQSRVLDAADTDRYLNFTFQTRRGTSETIQFINQSDPRCAAKMLREMADKIEGRAM